jgi:hypothetical protein
LGGVGRDPYQTTPPRIKAAISANPAPEKRLMITSLFQVDSGFGGRLGVPMRLRRIYSHPPSIAKGLKTSLPGLFERV